MPVPPGQFVAGRYRVQSQIGRGGMATVWRAHDERTRRDVALKLIDESLVLSREARLRFVREARAASILDHPAIPIVWDAGEAEGILYIAMQLVDGETLSDRIRRALFPCAEAVRITLAAAAALEHAHSRGVIHRDVTSRNVMLAHDGRAMIVDFGLAAVADASWRTASRLGFGTAPYVPPEVVRGERATENADVYSLGVVLYEMLTGALPFAGERVEAVLQSILHGAPPPPSALRPDVPPEMDRIVGRMMAGDRHARYQTFADVRTDLTALHDVAWEADHAVVRVADLPARDTVPLTVTLRRQYLAIEPLTWVTMGRDAVDAEVFAQGATSSVVAALARLDGLQATTLPRGRGTARDDRARVRACGARLLFRGRLLFNGSSVRLAYAVIDPFLRHTITENTVDGSIHDAFALSDAVADAVARAFNLPDARRTSRSHDPAAREHYLQSLTHLHRSDNDASVDKAIAILERLSESDDGSAQHFATLARAYLCKFRLTGERVWKTRAAAACQQAVDRDPDAVDVLVTQGDVCRSVGHHQEAIELYTRALEQRQDHLEALLGLANTSREINRFTDSVAACTRAIAVAPSDWRARCALGRLYFDQGQYDRALRAWRDLSRLSPDNAWVHTLVGSAYFYLDRLRDALREYETAVTVHPTPDALMNVGGTLFYLGRFTEAAAAFDRAASLAPHNPLVWGELGCALRFVPGRGAEVEAALEKAVALMQERLAHNERDAEAWAELANWHATLGQRDPALDAIGRALAIAPDNTRCLGVALSVHNDVGNRREALQYCRTLVRRGYPKQQLLRDPYLASLREDPRFGRIISVTRVPSAATLSSRREDFPMPSRTKARSQAASKRRPTKRAKAGSKARSKTVARKATGKTQPARRPRTCRISLSQGGTRVRATPSAVALDIGDRVIWQNKTGYTVTLTFTEFSPFGRSWKLRIAPGGQVERSIVKSALPPRVKKRLFGYEPTSNKPVREQLWKTKGPGGPTIQVPSG